MKVWISKLGVLLSLAVSTTAAWSWDAQLGGDPTGGQSAHEQNFVNQTGQYQGGGHPARTLHPDYEGMCAGGGGGGGDTFSGSGSREAGAQGPRQELRQSQQSSGVNQDNPNRMVNNSFHMLGGLTEALGSFAGGGSGTRELSSAAKPSSKPANATPQSEASGSDDNFEQMVQLFGNNNTAGGGGTASFQSESRTMKAPKINHDYPTGGKATSSKIQKTMGDDMIKDCSADGSCGPQAVSSAAMGAIGGASVVKNLNLQNAPGANAGQSKANQNAQKEQGADNLAAMERYHAAAAIDWVRSFLVNFTTDGGNKWNQVRDRLFVPMAILLLLPGALICQVKSIASQGLAVLGEVSPFEGIFRSIVGIFLIPCTYLVVNYGIDVANSITFTIASQYRQQFGSDMYADAFCGHIRAFPVRTPDENPGMITDQKTVMFNYFGNTPLARLEGKTLAIKYEDPCSGLYIVPPDRNNDNVPYMVNEQRLAYNQANAAFSMAWVILCAVQQGYLYYLYFVGPVVAALWVFPSKQLRDAFPSWIEGVVTICFWSLFWNVTILLMACFRGVDDTGTIMFTALNFLAIGSAKFAFDFTGLVKDAGREAMSMAQKAAQAAAAASKKGGGGGGGAGGGGGGGCGGGKDAKGGEGNSSGGNSQGGSEGGSGPSDADLSAVGSNQPSFDLADSRSVAGGVGAHQQGNIHAAVVPDKMPPSANAKVAHSSTDLGNNTRDHLANLGKEADRLSANRDSNAMVRPEADDNSTYFTSLSNFNANANAIESGAAPADTKTPPLSTVAATTAGTNGQNGAAGADASDTSKAGNADLKNAMIAEAIKADQDQKKLANADHVRELNVQANERHNQEAQSAKEHRAAEAMNKADAEKLCRTSADLNGDAKPVAPAAAMQMDPVSRLSRDSFDANSAIAMGSLDAANKAAIDATNAIAAGASNIGTVASDVVVTTSNTSSDNLVLPKDTVSSDSSVVGIDYSSSGSSVGSSSYGYDNSSADYQFRNSVDASASSLTSDDYMYPSLTIDGANSSSAQSHAFYEQTYATAYEQTYATAFERSSAAAANQAQSIQSERQYAAEQKQLEAREQAQTTHIANGRSSDMSSQSVRMSSKGVSDNRTTNFLTGLVKTATSSNTPPSSQQANAPQQRGRASNPANTGNDSNASKTAGTAGTTPDADWNSHIANEVLKRRARSVKKQSADEKAADLKALRNMTSKQD